MIKKRRQLLFGLLLFVIMSSIGFKVSAQEQLGSTHTQELIIVKYGLSLNSTGFSESQTVNDGEQINNIPVDNNGKELTPMAGIHYFIQKISPTVSGDLIKLDDTSTYTKLGAPANLVTNTDGIAQINLQDGFYIVSEAPNKNEHLTNPAQPILLRLPVVNTMKNGYLNQVYIYPKSSIDPLENVPPTLPTPKNKTSNLPKTGEENTVNLNVLGVVFTSLAIIVARRNLKLRRNEEENEPKQVR